MRGLAPKPFLRSARKDKDLQIVAKHSYGINQGWWRTAWPLRELLSLHCVSTESRLTTAMHSMQDEAYPMHLPKLGHAVIVNNLCNEFPGTRVDAVNLQNTFIAMGFHVHMYYYCTKMVRTT